jgi:hypothetical protein
MLEPRMSPSTRVWLERLQAMPINEARRSDARIEFERAELSAARLLAIVDRLRLLILRQTFATRRHRLGSSR